MAATPLVELSEVTKRYGAAPAPVVIDRISLQAVPGEFVSLIGPSGCGKSTLLRLIAGLSPVTEGRVTVAGREADAGAAELAFVFQEPTLLPWLTVARNLELPLKLRGIARDERAERCARGLELVRLTDKARAYPRQLSGGQKMRVSLARALALAPKLLLLDEPFGALDEITREHLNEELLAIRQELRWTAFFVTHSVAEAVFLSTRIVVMSANPGRVHTEIPVELPHPRTAETRRSHAYQDLVAQVSGVLREVEAAGGVA